SSRPTLSRREARTSGSRGPLSSGSAEVTSPCLRCELFIGPLRVGGTPAATLWFEGPGGYSAFPGEPLRTSTYVEVGGHPSCRRALIRAWFADTGVPTLCFTWRDEQGGEAMTDSIYRVTEVIGTSSQS